MVGGIAPADLEPLAKMFAAIDSPETLWIISSDFTHYGENFRYTPFGESATPEELNRLDREAAERIAARDLDGFCRFLGRTGATICGANPIALYLALLDRVDPERKISGEIVSMADSGEVTGDYSHVVDYAGILFR